MTEFILRSYYNFHNPKQKVQTMILNFSKSFLYLIVFSFVSVVVNLCFAATQIEGIRTFSKNLNLSQAVQKKLEEDLAKYHEADNLWDVLREEFTLSHYENHPAIQAKISWYMNNQDFLITAAVRAAPFLYFVYQQVKKHHLPAEVVLLPIIESGYNPFAISSVGATGLWQMMPDTATGLGLKQNTWYDGRRDIIASTKAALNYLSYLQSFFEGNWLLALAAYNTGEGNVLAAIKKNIKLRKNTDFWSLPVAQQTKDYVPRLLALATIISHPDQFPIYFPPVKNAPFLAQLEMGPKVNFKQAAILSGMAYKKLMMLNPGFDDSAITKKRAYKIIVPIENVKQFADNFRRSLVLHQLNKIFYKVQKGDSLYSISKSFDVPIITLKLVNQLAGHRLKIGSSLIIPIDDQASSVKNLKSLSNHFVNNDDTNRPYLLKPGDTIYVVRPNDNLESISKRFAVSKELIMIANHLTTSKLTSSNQLIIPTHQHAANSFG